MKFWSNKMTALAILSLTQAVFLASACSKQESEGNGPSNPVTYDVPGVEICHYKASSRMYPGSPSICILEDGTYLVSVEQGGPACPVPKQTDIYASEDKGETWTLRASIAEGQAWSNIFLHSGNVYIMGTDAPNGNIVIRKSSDGGHTWTGSVSAGYGLLRSGEFHTAPTPAVVHEGRIYRAFEAVNPNFSAWPKEYNAMIMSAPADSDLMDAGNWTFSNQLPYDPGYLEGYFGGWLEGNAVPGPDGKMKLVMRVEMPQNQKERIAVINVSDDGSAISFDETSGFYEMPGGAKKFTIRYDEESGRYWTLSNYVKKEFVNMNPGYVRNTLTLCSSADLKQWTVHEVILSHDDVKNHAFQYIDWLPDGNDMVFVSRTAFDDRYGGADSYHNANFITFHRIADFREKLSETYTGITQAQEE